MPASEAVAGVEVGPFILRTTTLHVGATCTLHVKGGPRAQRGSGTGDGRVCVLEGRAEQGRPTPAGQEVGNPPISWQWGTADQLPCLVPDFF